jgi:hypothetical protein
MNGDNIIGTLESGEGVSNIMFNGTQITYINSLSTNYYEYIYFSNIQIGGIRILSHITKCA